MKTSRKKILLSSVAMLLVALVALGSATYAWFTLNKTVYADGMNVKATSAEGLLIRGKNQDTAWGPKYTFTSFTATSPKILSPVSLAYTTSDAYGTAATPVIATDVSKDGGGPYTTADAAEFKNWSTTSIPTVSAAANAEFTANNDYFMVYEVQVKSSSEKELTGVKMNVSFTDADDNLGASEFIRVAVFEEGTLKYVGATQGTSETFNAVTSATKSGDTWTVTTADQKTQAFATDVAVSNATSTAKTYKIVIWFEGQDAQCTNAHQQAQGTVRVDFSY